jgi:hypothetical protein
VAKSEFLSIIMQTMELSNQVSSAVKLLAANQEKWAKVCLWVDSASSEYREIIKYFDFLDPYRLSHREKIGWVLIFFTIDNEIPKDFPSDVFDLIIHIQEEQIIKINIPKLNKAIKSNHTTDAY